MKNIYYSIQYKEGFHSYSLMNQYKSYELAEKDCQKKNEEKKNEEITYFVGLESEDIEKAWNYKGFDIFRKEKWNLQIYKNENGKRTYITWKGNLKKAKEFINNYLLSEKLFDWQKSIKQYRPYSVRQLIIEKSFNHGSGSLALFKILPEEKKIKVNSSLATKRDMENIKDLQKALRLENYEVFNYSYGYPEYYSHNF